VNTIAVLMLATVLAGGVVSPTPGTCACAASRASGGWCDVHDVGFIGGVEIHSRDLLEVLDAHGHDVDPTTFRCPACQLALRVDGFCDTHRVGFVDGLAYFSRLSHHLASGQRMDPAAIECPVCKRNTATHGWCDRCGRGMVGNVALDDREAFDQVLHDLAIVVRADQAASRCRHCAAAMVTDTECPICRIAYRDGVPVSP
jgi:hypothetical protein